MTPISALRRWLLVAACASPLLLTSSLLHAQTASPPAKTYFVDEAGNRIGVKERWLEDANGQRHGKYLQYNKKGFVIQSLTYAHGVLHGAAIEYVNNNFSNFRTPDYFANRPDYKLIGTYTNEKKTGIWSAYLHESKLAYKVYYNASGKLLKTDRYDTTTGKLVGTEISAAADKITPVQIAPPTPPISDEERKRNSEALAKSQREKDNAERIRYATRDIDTGGIGFYQDSYILNRAGREMLDTIVYYVNARKQVNKPVKYIDVGVLTRKASKEMESRRAMYVLSSNRGVVIRAYLRQKLDDKALEINVYPLGGEFNRDYNHVDDHQEAVLLKMDGNVGSSCACLLREDDKTTLAQYNMPAPTNRILPNEDLKQEMLNSIRSAFNNAQKRYDMDNVSTGRSTSENGMVYIIPTEFWLPNITGIMPITLTTSEEPATFRSQVNALVDELNKTYRVNIKPEVFFTQDLKRRPIQ
ncbi:toxin-antitoxin system YwqK family antitoxin [Hymenobacter fodinae]|uniref:MORN repeat protein n=1 Tax=Hymenobacter fodinae TaxID=2510796 RepID=A0A4Z0P610_9BACT|nr:hypothetical protein [Hymenobacter fodinae]TGE06098.1 hypothetical protein EU556_14620 [Hymenobacter fodinae]